jgi:hypothetical protein
MLDFVIVRMLWGVIETFATIEEATEYALRRGIRTIEVMFTEYINGEPVTYGKILAI